jgi:hypothetical protein
MQRPPAANDEDELGELPPIDGESDSPRETDLDVDGIDTGAEGDKSLDDATAESEPVDADDLDLDPEEPGWLNDAPDAPDLDVGDPAIVPLGSESSRPEDDEEPGVGNADFGLDDREEATGLDSGEEGPLAADDELRDQDLPALDADEDGDPEELRFMDDKFAADEPLGLLWAARPWASVGAPVGLGATTAVACVSRGALVAGRSDSDEPELLRIDLEGARQATAADGLDRGAGVRALAVDGEVVAVATEEGRAFVSRDGGGRFEAIGGVTGAVDVVLASGVLWVRTRAGELFASVGPGRAVEKTASAIAAIAPRGPGDLVALAVDVAGRPTAVLRGAPDGSLQRDPIVEAPEPWSPACLAARGPWIAYPTRGGVVRRGPDGSWRRFTWEGRVTTLVFVDEAGALLAATYSDADDTTGLVCLDAAGHASVVARIGATHGDVDSDGRVFSMACDNPRGVVWVAGGFGLVAFAMEDATHPLGCA